MQSQNRPSRAGYFVFISDPPPGKPGRIFIKTKPPCLRHDGLFCDCGERGIRTPGPAIAEQRFSRPPHSTALASLHSNIVIRKALAFLMLAEKEGFEPPVPSQTQRFSRPPHSTALPFLLGSTGCKSSAFFHSVKENAQNIEK